MREVLDLHLLHDAVALALVRGVAGHLARADAVERRLGDVQVAGLDDLGHVAVEEGHQERPDVGTVDVRVREQDDLVVAQLGEVEGLTDARAEGDDQRPDLLAREHPVDARLLDVQHLAEQGQDGLEPAVAPLLGRATGRVALDDVQLAPLRVPLLAVGQLARQGRALEGTLADDEVASLAGRLAGTGRGERLLDDAAGVPGFSSRYWLMPSATAVWTWPLTSALPSLALVWPSNCGSVSFTLMTAVRPSRTSSPRARSSCP